MNYLHLYKKITPLQAINRRAKILASREPSMGEETSPQELGKSLVCAGLGAGAELSHRPSKREQSLPLRGQSGGPGREGRRASGLISQP